MNESRPPCEWVMSHMKSELLCAFLREIEKVCMAAKYARADILQSDGTLGIL